MRETELLIKYEIWCRFREIPCTWIHKHALQCWLRNATRLNQTTVAHFAEFLAILQLDKAAVRLDPVEKEARYPEFHNLYSE